MRTRSEITTQKDSRSQLTLKAQFMELINKNFRLAGTSRNFIQQVAKRLAIDNISQAEKDPEAIISNHLLQKIYELQDYEELHAIKTAKSMLDKFFTNLQIKINTDIYNMLMVIVREIIKPSNLQSPPIPNIWHAQRKNYDCVCKNSGPQQGQQVCYSCDRISHPECFWEKTGGQLHFQCPVCFLKNCLPDRPVKQILFLGYLPSPKVQEVRYRLKFYYQSKKDSSSVQMRCCRLTPKYRYLMAFPQQCTIFLGQKKLQDFYPLPSNSSIKRRADQPIKINTNFLKDQSVIRVEQKQINSQKNHNEREVHLVMIAVVGQRSAAQIKRLFIENSLSTPQSKQALRSYLQKDSGQLAIQKVSVTLICHFFGSKMRYPARSKHCYAHYQPFDIQGFIKTSSMSHNATQNWRCPICKARAYDSHLDSYLSELISSHPNIAGVAFDSKGNVAFQEKNQPQEEDKCQSEQQKNTPKKQLKPESVNQGAIQIIDSDDQSTFKRSRAECVNDDIVIVQESSLVRKQHSIENSQQQREASERILDFFRRKKSQEIQNQQKNAINSFDSNHNIQPSEVAALAEVNQQDVINEQRQLLNETLKMIEDPPQGFSFSQSQQYAFNHLYQSFFDFKINK